MRVVVDWNSTVSTLIASTLFGRGVLIVLNPDKASICARLTSSVYSERAWAE